MIVVRLRLASATITAARSERVPAVSRHTPRPAATAGRSAVVFTGKNTGRWAAPLVAGTISATATAKAALAPKRLWVTASTSGIQVTASMRGIQVTASMSGIQVTASMSGMRRIRIVLITPCSGRLTLGRLPPAIESAHRLDGGNHQIESDPHRRSRFPPLTLTKRSSKHRCDADALLGT